MQFVGGDGFRIASVREIGRRVCKESRIAVFRNMESYDVSRRLGRENVWEKREETNSGAHFKDGG